MDQASLLVMTMDMPFPRNGSVSSGYSESMRSSVTPMHMRTIDLWSKWREWSFSLETLSPART